MRYLAYSLLLVFTIFSSGAQEDCRPPLNSFGVHREELSGGWLHTTGGLVNNTRMLEVDYLDNRRMDQFEFVSQGWVDLTNISKQNRKIKYRHEVSINFGAYTTHQDTLDYEVCASGSSVTFYCEENVMPGETKRVEWSYTVEIEPFGDLNGDGLINGYDMGLFFAEWGMSDSPADFNNDGIVDPEDLAILLTNWR